MDRWQKAGAFGAAWAAGGAAHVVSFGKYLVNSLHPVIERDIQEIEQHGRLPAVPNPLPKPGQADARPAAQIWWQGIKRGIKWGALLGAILAPIAALSIGQDNMPPAGLAITSAMFGVIAGMPLGGFLSWLWHALVIVPRVQQDRLREEARQLMQKYWWMREEVRVDLDNGELLPSEAVELLKPWLEGPEEGEFDELDYSR